MADKDEKEPSLELPSFGFGRRRGRKSREPRPDPQPAADIPRTDTPRTDPPSDTAPSDTAPPDRAERPAERPAAPDASRPSPPARRPAPAASPAPSPPPARPTRTEAATQTRVDTPAAPAEEEASSDFSLPRIPGMAASIVTGLVVGALTVGLTGAGFALCEVVRGTSSCGNPGFLLLLAIMVAMVLLGMVLLRAWAVADPGSTSFLAVGLLAVLALLFLVDVLFAWWMIIVIPALTAATYALSYWVTTAVAEPTDH